MVRVLLVPDARLRASCWGSVALLLQEQRWDGFPLELDPAASLADHVRTVVEAIDGGIRKVVLAGHGYGGMVISGACEQRPLRVTGLVYLDALVPQSGQRAVDLLPAEAAAPVDEQTLFAAWGVSTPEQQDALRPHLSALHPPCLQDKLTLPLGWADQMKRAYIAAGLKNNYPMRSALSRVVEQARENGWLLNHLDAGHACMVEQPRQVALSIAALARVAR
jgi:pimeloyl-ACP methyl ester carboxylesterase